MINISGFRIFEPGLEIPIFDIIFRDRYRGTESGFPRRNGTDGTEFQFFETERNRIKYRGTERNFRNFET